jgi:hypothetical protein
MLLIKDSLKEHQTKLLQKAKDPPRGDTFLKGVVPWWGKSQEYFL